MAFNYDKNKNHSSSGDSFWTSYSDLFLGLSSIFLLLYVTASLRTGTGAMHSQIENQKLTMKVEELQNQLKMYESIKNEYMDTAPKDEKQEYQELMDKLVLLQEEAKNERDRLAMEARENEEKRVALNKYQQMVRNILNANKVAKSKIATRDEIIVEQDTEITEQKNEIAALEADVAEKKKAIEENQLKIAQTENRLEQKMKDLQKALKANKLTRAAYQKQVAQAKAENEKRVAALKAEANAYNQQLAETNAKLNEVASNLASTQTELTSTQGELEKKGAELRGLTAQLAQKQGEAEGLRGQIDSLRAGYEAERARERAAFENQIKEERLTGAQKAAREAAFRAQAEAKARAMGNRLAGLQGQLKDTESALARAKEEMDTRKAVAREIQRSFDQAGVKADIDLDTGEVLLDFGDAYFDVGSAKLKPEMKDVLEKAMPAYSKSLFGNPKVADKITSVEVVGFASPTYKGRYINPKSTNPEDIAALKYNMDLSYERANAIFKHLVDGKSGDFTHRRDLTPLMKVSGRSFLEVMKVQDRNIATAAEFCKVNDCKKAQRVIIRFSMDGKKK